MSRLLQDNGLLKGQRQKQACCFNQLIELSCPSGSFVKGKIMGYTHYVTTKRKTTDQEWNEICNDFQHLLTTNILIGGPTIQLEYDDPRPPRIDQSFIQFNGAGDSGYETMILERNPGARSFCKTIRKGYDIYVKALLIFAYNAAPTAFGVTSDGTIEEWEKAQEWVNSVMPFNEYVLPASLY